MIKSIYKAALEAYHHIKAIVLNKKSHLTWEQEVHHLANITRALQQAQKQEEHILKVVKAIKKDELSKFQILSILSAIIGISNEYDEMNLDDLIKGELK